MKINKMMSALALALGLSVAAQAQLTTTTTTTQIPPTTTQAIYISGSTAFRSQIWNGLNDLGLTPQTDDASGNNIFTFTGTPSTNVVANTAKPGWGTLTQTMTNTSVTVYCSFDGSEQGVKAAAGLQNDYFENVGGFGAGGTFGYPSNACLFSSAATMAFSDVEQASTVITKPVLAQITSQDALNTAAGTVGTTGYGEGICVQPFLWAANAAAVASNVVNIDAFQAALLFVNGSVPLEYWTGNPNDTGMNSTFSTAVAADQVALTGRDISSGTRITAEFLTPYPTTTQIRQYEINGSGSDPAGLAASLKWGPSGGVTSKSTDASIDGGYSSGGKVADALMYPGATPAVGYLSFADAKAIQNPSASITSGWTTTPVAGNYLSFNGVSPYTTAASGATKYPVYNIAAVQNGEYTFWSYEHLYLAATGSAGYPTTDFGPGLAVAVVYEVAQQIPSSPITAILESTMNVSRTQDGGSVVNPNSFAQ